MKSEITAHGIDEAGYGPLLGPLVVARTDFTLTSDRGVRRTARGRDRLLVEDSKKLLTRARGFARMEAAALGVFTAVSGRAPASLGEWLSVDPRDAVGAALGRAPWYDALDRPLPLAAKPEEVDEAAAHLAEGRVFTGGRLTGFGLRVLPEEALNVSLARTENKHESLFQEVVELIEEGAGDGTTRRFTIDKLGGRSYYADKLACSFPFVPIDVESESRGESRYVCRFATGDVHLRFLMKGDDRVFEVALASLCAKYTREVLMGVFNEYWGRRAPGIRPTAGYYEDGRRFLGDLAEQDVLTDELRERLVRQR